MRHYSVRICHLASRLPAKCVLICRVACIAEAGALEASENARHGKMAGIIELSAILLVTRPLRLMVGMALT